MTDLPIACNLTSAELQERRRTVLQKFRDAVIEVIELENGYAYSLPAGPDRLEELTTMIELERQCCPFLQFRLSLPTNNAPVWLELSGPEGTKEFLASTFNQD